VERSNHIRVNDWWGKDIVSVGEQGGKNLNIKMEKIKEEMYGESECNYRR